MKTNQENGSTKMWGWTGWYMCVCVCMWTAFFAQKQNTHDRQHCAENGTECDWIMAQKNRKINSTYRRFITTEAELYSCCWSCISPHLDPLRANHIHFASAFDWSYFSRAHFQRICFFFFLFFESSTFLIIFRWAGFIILLEFLKKKKMIRREHWHLFQLS